jgi:hypothetical protein
MQGNSKMVMPAADLAITKSGSVNLELALFNVSQATNHVLHTIKECMSNTSVGIFLIGDCPRSTVQANNPQNKLPCLIRYLKWWYTR